MNVILGVPISRKKKSIFVRIFEEYYNIGLHNKTL